MDRPDSDRCRALLETVIALTVSGGDLGQIVGTGLSEFELATALEPVAASKASIPRLVTNGERVDAVLDTSESHWRVVFGSSDRARIEWINVTARPDIFEGIERGRAVVLNGPSGAGKSTLMQAIQTRTTVPWVIFDEPEDIGSVKPGYLIWRDQVPTLHCGYLQAIASLASAGNYVAVAAAGHHQRELEGYFADIPTLWVGLHCDPAALAEREQRSGRWGGIAESSLGIHDGWCYDLTFDTTHPNAPPRSSTPSAETPIDNCGSERSDSCRRTGEMRLVATRYCRPLCPAGHQRVR